MSRFLLDDSDDSDNEDDLVEDRDRIFYTQFSPPKDICATSTGSQRLAEAFAKNSAPGKDELPEWVHDFEDVFNLEAFDSLPDRQSWDHAIELVPDSKLAKCKVYPISPLEQRELNAFIEEGFSTSQIRPSKSLMASLVFFVNQKDGGL